MKTTILVIDDEENIRFTFKEFLSAEGHKVVTIEDFHSAIEKISKIDIDLIFVDIILKKHTGIDILKAVKNKGLHCPVIVITGQPDLDTASASVRLGAFDYLPKPVLKENLLHATRLALQHKMLIDEKEKVTNEMERYHRHLKAIFRSVKDGIITINQKMQIIEANQEMNSICGFDFKKSIGKNINEISNKCNRSCHHVLTQTLKMKKTIREYRIECGYQNRSQQVVVLNSSPLTDIDNQFIGAVLVIRDITRQTELEKELLERNQFHNLIGKSKKMQEIYNLLDDLVDTETTVLITGESGTGKELVANALHYGGIRALKPFVKVNCSALSENLLESELFGHVRGAFTGAVKDKKGRFEIANKGTILLDEIGDLSPRLQLKLLRVLQEKEFERVGDSKSIKIDVRVLASTNCDIKEKVKTGKFREDLYYRLKVVEIPIPPLREKLEDIPILIKHFCQHFNKSYNKNIEYVSDEVLKLFMQYSWPGNVRELEHTIEHTFVLCKDRIILVDHLPADIKLDTGINDLLDEEGATEEKYIIIKTLHRSGWNKAKAARMLGISRQTMYRKIKTYGLKEQRL
jgi:PAS domain S-box-containing protein